MLRAKFVALKIAALLIGWMILPNAAMASAEEPQIWVMDTLEFVYTDNKAAKERYLKNLAQILRDMRIQEQEFDSTTLADSQIRGLIEDQERWNQIMIAIDKACQLELRRQICDRLAAERLKVFDFILDNPEY